MPTRRQTKRAIRSMERQHYKQSGGLFRGGRRVVGKNTAAVQKAHQRALDADDEYQNLSRKATSARESYIQARKLQNSTDSLFRNTMQDESKGNGYRVAATVGSAVASANTQAKFDASVKASRETNARWEKVGKQFTNQYKDAFIKDLGFADVDAGKKFIKEQNLDAYLNRRIARYQYRVS